MRGCARVCAYKLCTTALSPTKRGLQARAATKEEAAVITKPLTSADIRAILAGPANVMFGKVSAAADAKAHFSVNNALGKPVHVLVDAKCHDHLVRSQFMSQVRARS